MKRILTTISIALGITLCTWIGSAIGIARASRNSSGTYSSPVSPFVSNTIISSANVNSSLSDIGTELTDSLSRSGKGGMLAPVRVPDGSQSSPTMSFTNETGTGFYRIGALDVGFSVNGTKRQEWTSTGSTLIGIFGVQDSGGTNKTVSVSAPSGLAANYSFILPTALPGSTLPVTLTSGGQLSTGQITGSQMANNTITRTQLSVSVGQQVSTSSGTFGTSSTTFVDVTNLSVTITTTGRPVMLVVQSDGSGNANAFQAIHAGSGGAVYARILRGASEIAQTQGANGGSSVPNLGGPGGITFLDTPGAGTYTYKVQAKVDNGATTGQVYYCVLVAYEL